MKTYDRRISNFNKHFDRFVQCGQTPSQSERMNAPPHMATTVSNQAYGVMTRQAIHQQPVAPLIFPANLPSIKKNLKSDTSSTYPQDEVVITHVLDNCSYSTSLEFETLECTDTTIKDSKMEILD